MKQTEKAMGTGMERPSPAGAGNTGDKTEDLRGLDENALNQPELLTSVEDRLKNLGDLTRPVRPGRSQPAADDDEDEDKPGEENADGKPEKGDKGDEKPADEPADSKSPTLEDNNGLPEAYVRCAEAYGWKREAVIDFYKADPERAMTTLSNIYQTRNKASAEFAALGRKAKQDADTKVPEPPRFQTVDTAKLKETYGEDAGPLIEMIEAQNKVLNQLAEQLPKPQKREPQPFESVVEQNGVEQHIHNFFQSDRMKPYDKVYGTLGIGQTWHDLTPSQQQFRWRVLEKADQIAGGAHLQGMDMQMEEALESAHLLVTQQYRDQILIEGIKGKVVARSKGTTLRPSQGTKRPGGDTTEQPKPGTRSREQLTADVGKRLLKMFPGG